MRLKILVGICLVLVLLSSGGCITLSGVDGKPIAIEKDGGEVLFFVDDVVVSHEGQTLHALVKGSIYETGEAVSVFGTCLDGDDEIINGTYAVISSWYPNGTMLFSNVSMVELQKGYYVYQSSMNAVEGTYLTELRCMINGSDEFALAWGEWQNPRWVKKIGQINETVGDIVIQIGDVAYEMNQSFEITWDMIESVNVTLGNVYTNLSSEIYVVGQIANNSVDRNDSYIVYLLNQIITGIPADGNMTLTWNETADSVQYYRNWDIEVRVVNSQQLQVGWPLVACYINTTNSPPTVDQLMESKEEANDPHFFHRERVQVLNGFTWSVSCVYN